MAGVGYNRHMEEVGIGAGVAGCGRVGGRKAGSWGPGTDMRGHGLGSRGWRSCQLWSEGRREAARGAGSWA